MATTEEAKPSKRRETKYRVLEVVQYAYYKEDENGKKRPCMESERTHDDDDGIWIDEQQIKEGLDHKTIKEWAWVYHDKDPYTEDDYAVRKKWAKVGESRPPHYHIMLHIPQGGLPISTIAKWFQVPENMIDIKSGHNGWLEGVRYLTHEADKQQEKGKHRYEDTEIHANFDFRALIDKRYAAEKIIGYIPESNRDLVRGLVSNGIPLSQIQEEYPREFQNDLPRLEALRRHYVKKIHPMPNFRVNFYLEGEFGMGKTQLAKLLAKCLFPELGDWMDDELFFIVGGENAKFDGYDGQPVVIWDEARAEDIIFNVGRGEFLKIFDPFPSRANVNIKHSSTCLTNAIHIVNGIQPFDEFVDRLAGEYTDKHGEKHESEESQRGQFYRRFPFFISIHPSDFEFFMNKGWLEQTREYDSFMKLAKMRGSFGELLERAGNNSRKRLDGAKKLFEPLQKEFEDLKDRYSEVEDDGAEFDDGGEFAIMVDIPDEERIWRRGDSSKRRKNEEKNEEKNHSVNPSIFDDDTPF